MRSRRRYFDSLVPKKSQMSFLCTNFIRIRINFLKLVVSLTEQKFVVETDLYFIKNSMLREIISYGLKLYYFCCLNVIGIISVSFFFSELFLPRTIKLFIVLNDFVAIPVFQFSNNCFFENFSFLVIVVQRQDQPFLYVIV